MKFLKKLARSLRRVTESFGADVDSDAGWRRISGSKADRDLTPVRQERMQDFAVYLWERSGLAKFITSIRQAYTFGEGLDITADNAQMQAVIDDFINDPVNQFNSFLLDSGRDLDIFGEQFWTLHTENGYTRLGYLDPKLVSEIILDPDNCRVPIGVKTSESPQRFFRVIHNAEDADIFGYAALQARATYTDGDVYFFCVNRMIGGSRGRSELLPVADLIDVYERILLDSSLRLSWQSAYVWDITMTGATADEVRNRANELTQPSPGAARVHNENETWQAVTPGLDAANTEVELRLVRNAALGAFTLPEHWYGGGGDVNLATASAMGSPTYKAFTARQKYWQAVLVDFFSIICNRWQAAHGLDYPVNITVEMPEVDSQDTSRFAAALTQVISAGGVAMQQGLVDRETAAKWVNSISGLMGIQYDVGEVLATAKDEQQAALENAAPFIPQMEGGQDSPPAVV